MNYLIRMMLKGRASDQKILITGGTSGLGLQLVHFFLEEGYYVVATGRQAVNMERFGDNYSFYRIDFSDLKQVAIATRNICRDHNFSLIVNNAGILSPPAYTETHNGLEYTFQINFLSHLLINEIFISCSNDDSLIRIATVTSPVYRFASIRPLYSGSADYNPVRSYSSSKLYMAMMPEFLISRHGRLSPECFSFDPGTFSSGIYRMQNGWFRVLYRIAAPFMRSPLKVAKALADIMLKTEIENGSIYDASYRQKSLPAFEKNEKEAFIDSCYKLIDPFLN
jgi:NAD(P)-dependent dehydrogenase (short-subunit alcohol dehydrogenase family)